MSTRDWFSICFSGSVQAWILTHQQVFTRALPTFLFCEFSDLSPAISGHFRSLAAFTDVLYDLVTTLSPSVTRSYLTGPHVFVLWACILITKSIAFSSICEKSSGHAGWWQQQLWIRNTAMALNPNYEQIGKAFTDQYYRLFDDPAQRPQLVSLYNVSWMHKFELAVVVLIYLVTWKGGYSWRGCLFPSGHFVSQDTGLYVAKE